MTRLSWLTDVHWDHSGPVRRNELARKCADVSDCCVITGDISTGDRIVADLSAFQKVYGKPVYIVLGNHDFYRSSFATVTTNVGTLCHENSNLHWLEDGTVHQIGNVQLCGVGGWYDYQAGLVDERLNLIMTDWNVIADMTGNFAHYRASMDSRPLVNQLRELGQNSAVRARETLSKVDPGKPVFFATHVPPYREAAWHLGNQTDDVYAPYFTNLALGFALTQWCEQNRSGSLTTLCGHVHSAGACQPSQNHLVLTGAAEYGNPVIQKVFEL